MGWGGNVIIGVLKRWKGEVHSHKGAVTTETEAGSQGQLAWTWRRDHKRRKEYLGPPEEIQACGHPAFSPVTPIWVFLHPEL